MNTNIEEVLLDQAQGRAQIGFAQKPDPYLSQKCLLATISSKRLPLEAPGGG
jgi:hypothetical protein